MLRPTHLVPFATVAVICLALPRLALAEGEEEVASTEAATPAATSEPVPEPEASDTVGATSVEAIANSTPEDSSEDSPKDSPKDSKEASKETPKEDGASKREKTEGSSPPVVSREAGPAAAVSVEAEGEPVVVESVEASVEAASDEVGTEASHVSSMVAMTKPWSATISHSFGWGLQADDTTGRSNGTISASGSYTLIKGVSLSASVGARYTLDKTPNDAVRLDLGAISVSLNHASLYRDRKYTGLNFSGGVTVSQALGMGTVRIGRAPTVGLRFGALRKVGPVGLSYGFGFNRFFPVDAAPRSSACAADRGSETLCLGGYASAWAISNSLSANYSPMKDLSLSASFVWNNARSFGPNKPDQYSSNLNPALTNRRENFGFSFSGTWTTPVEGLSAGLSFSNARPWRTDGQTLALVDFTYGVGMIFDARYAAMSLDLSYSF